MSNPKPLSKVPSSTWLLLMLVAGFFVCGFHVAFITAHLPAYLSDLGFDAKIGAWSVATIGLSLAAAALHWPIQEKPVERLTTQRMGAL